MKKNFKKNSKRYSRTLANIDKRRQVAVKQLQTQAVIVSSEEYIERAQEARSIVTRGFLQNDDKQAPSDDQNGIPDDVTLAILKRKPSESSESENDKEGNISPCEFASVRVEDRHRLLYKESTDNKNYTDDEVGENSDGEVYNDNVVDGGRKKKNSEIPLQEKQRKEINDSFNLMDKNKMWKLSSGRYVEEELYELGKKLDYEHAIHSFILDVEDEVVLNHFTEKEMVEIDQVPGPAVPELSENVIDCLSKFAGKTDLHEIGKILKEVAFDDKYNIKNNHDVDYIIFAIHALIREIESGKLYNNNIESWFNIHIWNFVFDQAFGNVKTISVVRGESSGIASSIRKNINRKMGTNRRMGRRGDWILRSTGKSDNDEFGVGEAGHSWKDKYSTKFLKESGTKLPKNLKDIIMKLMEKVKWNPTKYNEIQTVGIVHAGLIMVMLYLDNPKGYICRIRRSELMEVPDTPEKFPSILIILASVLNLKSRVLETMKVVMNSKENQDRRTFIDAGLKKRKYDYEPHRLTICTTTPEKKKENER
ncbi:26524_t:CDS:2, partial [Gigaspora margarita]